MNPSRPIVILSFIFCVSQIVSCDNFETPQTGQTLYQQYVDTIQAIDVEGNWHYGGNDIENPELMQIDIKSGQFKNMYGRQCEIEEVISIDRGFSLLLTSPTDPDYHTMISILLIEREKLLLIEPESNATVFVR